MLNIEVENKIYTQLCHYLVQKELEMLLTHAKVSVFARGETILQQGKKAEGIYIIVEGNVLVTAKILGEGFTHIETLGPGSFFGEISFIENGPCATSIIAESQEVRCLIINRTYFELIAIYFPETKYKILHAITQQICGRLKRMHDKIIAFITNSDMAMTLSFFGKVINSFTKPEVIKLEECGITLNQLYDLSLFKIFNKEEVDELIKHTILLRAPKNCQLIHEGAKSISCYIVIQGAVQSSIVQDNKIAKLSVIGPATLFASTSCIDPDSSFTITFATCEQAILLKIVETDLEFFQKNHLQLWYKLFDLICRSLVALEKSVDKLDIRLNIETYNR